MSASVTGAAGVTANAIFIASYGGAAGIAFNATAQAFVVLRVDGQATAAVTAASAPVGTFVMSGSANVAVSGTITGEILGEAWSDVADTAATWTDTTDTPAIWSTVTSGATGVWLGQ